MVISLRFRDAEVKTLRLLDCVMSAHLHHPAAQNIIDLAMRMWTDRTTDSLLPCASVWSKQIEIQIQRRT
ncbi:hypothetical protein DHEL01_v206150 [Diaporthe helianthi]|uniref:Uncharacterized protein n=1 Tax=Diaporthe helianthi TaxID=158607 RepID=A0A2P5HYX7_DIAHE|nr:hypothetical protein DHEL01_v206150 [Diaporthe helianthi]